MAQKLNFVTSFIYADEVTTDSDYRLKTLFVHAIVYGNVLIFSFLVNCFCEKRTKIKIFKLIFITLNIF